MGYARTKIAVYGISIEGTRDYEDCNPEPSNKLQILHNLIYDEEGKHLVDLPLYVDESFVIPPHTGDMSYFGAQLRHYLDGGGIQNTLLVF
jgi:hypothetical protein